MKPENAVPSRMSVQLRRALITIGLVAALLSVLVAAILFHRAFAAQVDQDLARTAQAVAAACQALAETDPDSLDSYLDNTSLRLTLIDPDGNVVYDSEHRNESDMDNHLSRPEIADAIAQGEGRSVRRSETIGRETHYYALRLANGQILRLGEETAGIWSVYNEVLPALAVAGVLVVALAALLAAVFTRRLVQPIIRMAEHLDTIEANVPYEELIPLARTIQSDRRLREDNENMRREFTANVSHELKTPLTLILSNLDIVEEEYGKNEWLDDIRSEGERMRLLIHKMVELSRMDEGALPAVCADFDCSAAVSDTVSEFQPLAAARGLSLETEIEAGLTCRGEEALLRRLTAILLDNAVKYCDPDGTIRVRLYRRHHPVLLVENTCAQVDALELDRLFDRFYRADKARTFSGSFGIGLYIAHSIASQYHRGIRAYKREGTIGFRVDLK